MEAALEIFKIIVLACQVSSPRDTLTYQMTLQEKCRAEYVACVTQKNQRDDKQQTTLINLTDCLTGAK